jgi:hypothetical protein
MQMLTNSISPFQFSYRNPGEMGSPQQGGGGGGGGGSQNGGGYQDPNFYQPPYSSDPNTQGGWGQP